jgi:hypothetical protein
MPEDGMLLNLWWSSDGFFVLRLEQNTVHSFNTVYITPKQQKALLLLLQAKYKETEGLNMKALGKGRNEAKNEQTS